MCGGGGGGSVPKPDPIPPPPAASPAPTIDVARQNRMQQDNTLARKGRAANILTSSEGVLSAPETGTKKLLGS